MVDGCLVPSACHLAYRSVEGLGGNGDDLENLQRKFWHHLLAHSISYVVLLMVLCSYNSC